MSNGVGNNTRAVGAKQAAAAIVRDAITIACRSVAYRRTPLCAVAAAASSVLWFALFTYYTDDTELIYLGVQLSET